MSKFIESYTFESDKSQFDRFYEVTQGLSKRLGLSEGDEYRFQLCLSEAFTNAVVHGNKLIAEKRVRLTFIWDADEVEAYVEDQGNGRPIEVEFDRLTRVPPEAGSGRGLGLIKSYADDLILETKPEGGLRVRILWRLRRDAQPVGPDTANAT